MSKILSVGKNALSVLFLLFFVFTGCDLASPIEDAIDLGESPSSIDISYAGDGSSINFTTNRYWHASIPEDVDWVTLSKAAGMAGQARIVLSIAENYEYEERSTVLTIEAGTAVTEIPINQTRRPEPEFNVTPNSFVLEADGGDFSLSIFSPSGYEIVSMPKWISVKTEKSTSAKLVFHALANRSPEKRTGVIELASGRGGKVVVDVFQYGQEDGTFKVTCENFSLPSEEGTISFDVISGLDYSVTSMPEWVSEVESKVAYTYSHLFVVSENTMVYGRNGDIVLEDSMGKQIAVHIEQSGCDHVFVLRQHRFDIQNDESTFTIELKTNLDYIIQYLNSADWITEIGSTSEIDSKLVKTNTHTFKVSSNEGSVRSVVLMFKTAFNDYYYVNVYQYGKTINVSVNPKTFSLSFEETTISFEVEANVDYSIKVDDNWITEVDSGSADKNVHTFKIAENNNDDSRTAYIQICVDGESVKNVSVTQSGLGDYFKLSQYVFSVPSSESTFELEVYYYYDYEFYSLPDWITEIESKGIKTNKHTFRVAANPDSTKRYGEIVLKTSSKTAYVNVMQEAAK